MSFFHSGLSKVYRWIEQGANIQDIIKEINSHISGFKKEFEDSTRLIALLRQYENHLAEAKELLWTIKDGAHNKEIEERAKNEAKEHIKKAQSLIFPIEVEIRKLYGEEHALLK